VFQSSGAPNCDGELWNECALQLDNNTRSTQQAQDLQHSIELLCAVLGPQICTAPGHARSAEVCIHAEQTPWALAGHPIWQHSGGHGRVYLLWLVASLNLLFTKVKQLGAPMLPKDMGGSGHLLLVLSEGCPPAYADKLP
jgi:hypothetical protein